MHQLTFTGSPTVKLKPIASVRSPISAIHPEATSVPMLLDARPRDRCHSTRGREADATRREADATRREAARPMPLDMTLRGRCHST